MENCVPIGVFDSGYGGLTVLKEITRRLPEYDFIYLGDNARAPYGTRSYNSVYEYTLECVQYLFSRGCRLVILACNTASAKALRSIQQKILPNLDPDLRVLGVIRPTAEVVGKYSKSGHVGILGTPGTVNSSSYILEIAKLSPHITVVQEACPMWVPLVENDEIENEGASFFVRKNVSRLLEKDPAVDTIVLGCTHYPLLTTQIRKFLPDGVSLLSQGEIVADSLADYLERHPDKAGRCTKGSTIEFLTTDSPEDFNKKATRIMEIPVDSRHVELPDH